MGNLIYKERTVQLKNIRETVYLNCSQNDHENSGLIVLRYLGQTSVAPRSTFTIKGHDWGKPGRLSPQDLYNKNKGFLIFSLSECPCEYSSGTFPRKTILPDEILFSGDCTGMKLVNGSEIPRSRYYLILEHNIHIEMMFGLSETSVFKCENSGYIRNVIHTLFEMVRDAGHHTGKEFSVLLFDFLTHVCLSGQTKIPFVGSYEPLFQKVAGYPQNYPTMDSLRELFRVSEATLKALFRKYTGKSPMEYVISSRLLNSCWQLRNTRIPIAEIAELNGYHSAVFYSKAFKKKFGMPPALFRMRNALPSVRQKT